MAGKAKHTATGQPGSRAGTAPIGRSESPHPRASVPEVPTVGMDSVAAAVLVCAPDGTIVDLNRMAAELLHVDPVSALGTALRDVRGWAGTWVDEAGAEIGPAESTVARLAFSGQPVHGEVVGLLGDGSGPPLWLRISAEPLLSPSGELEDVVITLVDITGLKETRDAMREVVSELNDLVETLPDTYIYVDAGDVVRRVTGARRDGPGVPGVLTGEGVGDPVWSTLSEEAAARLRKAAALARTTGKPVTAEIATVTPTAIRYDEVRQVPRDGGTLLFIVRDITESRRAAEALRQSEEKYRTLYLRTPVMLHSIDAEGRLLSVSDRWLQRLGYSADEVLGRPVTEFMTDESRRFAREEGFPTFLATGSLDDVPIQFVARDGSVIDVLLSATSEQRRRRLPAALSLGAGRRHRAAARRARPGRAGQDVADAAHQRPGHGVSLWERPRLEHADPQRRLPRSHRVHAGGADRRRGPRLCRHHRRRGPGAGVGRDPGRTS